jgi:hypothetical protein
MTKNSLPGNNDHERKNKGGLIMAILLLLLVALLIAAVISEQNKKNQELAKADRVENRLMLLEMGSEEQKRSLSILEKKVSEIIIREQADKKAAGLEARKAPAPESPTPAEAKPHSTEPRRVTLAPRRLRAQRFLASAQESIESDILLVTEAAEIRPVPIRAAVQEPPAEQRILETQPVHPIAYDEIAKDRSAAEIEHEIDSVLQEAFREKVSTATIAVSTINPPATLVHSPEPAGEPRKAYTEKASRVEMEFAGTYLNLIGIIFLIVGIVIYLSMQLYCTFTSGIGQSITGIALGILLVFTGHHLYQKNMQKFAHPLIAGGFCIVFFALCASYFHYHLIREWMLFLAIFITVAWSGISIFKYDSKLIGNGMLIAAFLAPFFMKFTFSGVGVISFYLIAINCGVAYVAYYKKWDYYLTVAFIATYILYFNQFHMSQPQHALFFLVAIYLLFLVSNNVLHFVRKSSSDYHVFLSYISPTIFAITSYFVLLKMANIWATLIYVGLAAIHLLLTYKARRMEEKDPHFGDIVKNNLVLGILFLTASISFITYFSKGTACFSIVTGLWFIEAYYLLKYSFQMKGYEGILRRYSYLAMTLASAQLLAVIPTMEADIIYKVMLFKRSIVLPMAVDLSYISRFFIYLASSGIYLNYFLTLYRQRARLGTEENYAATSSLLIAYGIMAYIIYAFITVALLKQVCFGLIAFVTLHISISHLREYERLMRRLSYVPMALMAYFLLAAVPSLPSNNPVGQAIQFLTYLSSAGIFFGYFLTLYRLRVQLSDEERYSMSFSLIASLITTYFMTIHYTPGGLSLLVSLAVAAFAMLHIGRRYFSEFGLFFRGYSYFSMLSLAYCLFFLFPLQDNSVFSLFSLKSITYTLGAIFFYEYFLTLHRHRASQSILESRAAMIPAALAGFITTGYLLLKLTGSPLAMEICGALLCAFIIYFSLKYSDVLKGYHNVGFLGQMAIAIIIIFCGFSNLPLFINERFMGFLLIAAIFALCGVVLKKHEHLLAGDEKWTPPAMNAMAALVVMKAFLLESTGFGCTFIWSLMALGLLHYGQLHKEKEKYTTISLILFFITFIKSIVFDANFVYANGTFSLSGLGTVPFSCYAFIAGIIVTYGLAARLIWNSPELRNLMVALALFIFCFQFSFILYRFCGLLDYFQVLLSGFWSIFAFSFITFGILRELKIFRQFGLMLLISSILKILFVDLWVLNSYNKVTTFVIIGALLMVTSFLYQKHRAIIAEKSQARRLALDPA